MRDILIILGLIASSVDTSAGECRANLRPLLLSTAAAAADIERVRQLCQVEADAGDPEALYQLALTYLGIGGEWSPERAFPMIREAAAQRVAEAQYWLAWQYESGPLLAHDVATALGWYLRAAEANHRLALARLAQASDRGELGLPVDPRKAAGYRARQARCQAESSAQDPM